MREESELVGDIERAKQAQAILNHPIHIAAIELLRQLTIDKFENLGFSDTLGMQECNLRLNLIEELEINLATVIQSGNSAFKALEDIQAFNQEMKNER